MNAANTPEAVRAFRAPAATLAIAVAAGLCASRAGPGHFAAWWTAALFCGGLWLCLTRTAFHRAAALAMLAGWLSLAAAWHDVCWSWIAPRDASRLATDDGVSVRLVAKVLEPAWIVSTPPNSGAPAWRPPERTLTTVECRDFFVEESREPLCGRVRLSITGEFPELTCGDVVSVIGKLRLPAERLNPGDFDFRTWLRAHGVHALLQVETVEGVIVQRRESSGSDVWGRWRQAFRQRAQRLIASALRPETAGVAETLLLGGRRRLDDELRQAFVDSGMLHVLAISGVNVALLGLWLTILGRLAGLSSRIVLGIAVVTLVLYAAVTDGDPPVVRATAMAVIGAAALWSGRATSVVQIVAVTLLGMMLVHPSDLFDAGAQLSFLSVLTISRTLAAWHERRRQGPDDLPSDSSTWPSWLIAGGKLWGECSLVSLGIWLATTPLVVWRFQLLSPIGLLLNVVLGPLIVVLMWAGYSFLIIGLIWPLAATPFAALFDGCLLGLIRSVQWASSISFGHLDVASPPAWWMVGYYGVIGALLLWGASAFPRKLAVRGLLAWTVIGLSAGLVPSAPRGLSCRFLAVGHGLSILLELPNGKTVLYDAGSLGDGRRAARVVSQELLRRGQRRIDALILSHADADHCNALPELLRTLPIGGVLIGPGFLGGDQPLPEQIVEACAARHVPVGLLSAGHQLALHPEVSLRVLHPSEEFYSDKDNPLSLVVAVEYRGRRILLTGDVEGDGLTTLLRQSDHDCDVLLSPHHGSKAANSLALAHWARPEWVVVSTQDAHSEDRLAETYPLSATLLATARRGAIEFCIDDAGELTVETFRGEGGNEAVGY
jgi:competence protein ComEC